jgi:hypothetical protein
MAHCKIQFHIRLQRQNDHGQSKDQNRGYPEGARAGMLLPGKEDKATTYGTGIPRLGGGYMAYPWVFP